ncbi:MAG: hypothetical protein WBG85_03490 [Rhodanobacter sp.]
MANTGGTCSPCPAWSSRSSRPSLGLIGFKLQALVNNPSRTRDLDDIRALLRAQRGRLNMQEVQGYFALFDRQEMLDELLAEIANDKA